LSAPVFGCFGFFGVFAFLSISNLLERESPDPNRAAGASVPRVVQSGAMVLVWRGALVLLLALSIAGCSGPLHGEAEVQVADGVLASGPWQARVYRSLDSAVCLQIRPTGKDPSTLCGIDEQGTGTWRPDSSEATFVAVTTEDPLAVTARLTLPDGSEVLGTLTPANPVSGLRFSVMALPIGVQPKALDILGADDSVLQSVPL
jgi:hypothetical protein